GVIADVIDNPNQVVTTDLGQWLFGKDGLDPYEEMPTTLWLVHWHLAGQPTKTTWYWVFNHFGAKTFKRDDLFARLFKLSTSQRWKRLAEMTIRRDVDCFLRTYASQPIPTQGALEDNLDSPLVELGLIRQIGKRDDYQFVRGSKPSLALGVFVFALNAFW